MKVEDLLSQRSPEGFVSRFTQLPAAVRRDPYRVGLLPAELLSRLLGLRWPAPRNFFMASVDGQPVATLSANISASLPEQGFIGFYECDLEHPLAADAACRLIGDAEAFLLRNGAKTALAPVNYSTWFPYRFLKPNASAPLYSWEPAQPPEYLAHFVAAGYTEGAQYVSIAQVQYTQMTERLAPALDRALQRGFSFRGFDGGRLLEHEVPLLYRISMESFRNGYLFEPIPFEMFRELYVPIARKTDFSLCFFLLDPAGKEVGFFFAFLDERHPDHFVIKTMALLDEARGEGLSKALVCHGFREAQRIGATRAIHALVRSDAQSRSYAKYAPIDWEHEYVLMGKTLQ